MEKVGGLIEGVGAVGHDYSIVVIRSFQQFGDAIPKGPAGGTIVDHGVRMEFRKGKKKTPFNLVFWAPRDGHMTSETIAGGCGFYPPEPGVEHMTTFCRGYGLDTPDKALRTALTIERSPDGDRLKLSLDGVLTAELKRAE